MSEKILRKKVNKEDFYPIYLKTLNGQLSLTGRELEVLVELCKIQAQNIEIPQEQLSKLVLSTSSRKLVSSKLNISPYNLNNIIKILKGRKIILENNYGYLINNSLFVKDSDTNHIITFNIEIYE